MRIKNLRAVSLVSGRRRAARFHVIEVAMETLIASALPLSPSIGLCDRIRFC